MDNNINEAVECIKNFLVQQGMIYLEDCEDEGVGSPLIIKSIIRDMDLCPDKIVMLNFFLFNGDTIEYRVFYSQTGAQLIKDNITKMPQLLRAINCINARIWPNCPSLSLSPRIYMTEDQRFDLVYTGVLKYPNLLAQDHTEEVLTYITYKLPTVLNLLSPVIFGIICGMLTIDDAIVYIKSIAKKLAEQ